MKKNGKWIKCTCGKEYYLTPSREKLGRGKYCSKACMAVGFSFNTGEENPNYKGVDHTFISKNKRIRERKQSVRRYCRDTGGKFKLEHRVIVEANIKRKLLKEEFVHHINCKPLDNRLENLFICSSTIHTKIHQRMSEHYAKLAGKEELKKLIEEVVNEQTI